VTAAKKKEEAKIAERIRAGTWWPFDRVDATLLQRLHRQMTKENAKHEPEKEQALL